ncbi:ABC transporter ATP-binding protein [Thiocystis violascens]|uniref:ABC-type polysaccharide/polyol phosphate transport system, ATPase component n=1 Tax=Thiocystis violascens (strain ATCC 17096 / DSM 198 / 6111) TaxID=765911 RepID=I3YFU4_THIV6|nr:ABC transporter ATP-binding protein [Thiocystis violascens]AFL75862.1 ABC-type polysaccharide/polyol phosphate transport system, ATPase component [Thiocystis violascens DSM 198]
MSIIEVEHLTKEFKLGQLESLKTTFLNQARRIVGQPVEQRALFKALDDVSFSIEAGEVVGIIGHNGAGKSTLLKLLANISTPTSGRIRVDGRIAPLIEVGAGFIPELTGRENVYLNASILGLSRKAIDRKFDDIVEFAEMEEFIDTPVKRYSSGMKVKLAFSVATSIDSEILIVDEVLAVGDLAFQRKCFDRMEDLIRRRGKTVLLVSHNIRQVSRICSRVLLLSNGRILMDGDPQPVADLFYRRSNEKVLAAHSEALHKQSRISTSGEAELLSIALIDTQGFPTDTVESGGKLHVRIKFELKEPLEKPEIVVGTHTTDFVYLDSGSTASIRDRPDMSAGIHEIEYEVDSFPLASGPYNIRFALLDKNRRMIYIGESLKTFVVTSDLNEAYEASARLLALPALWKLDGESYSSFSSSH